MLLPLIVRSRWATHAANNCAFNAAKSLASGTGTKQLRRYQPGSPATPPFSLPCSSPVHGVLATLLSRMPPSSCELSLRSLMGQRGSEDNKICHSVRDGAHFEIP